MRHFALIFLSHFSRGFPAKKSTTFGHRRKRLLGGMEKRDGNIFDLSFWFITFSRGYFLWVLPFLSSRLYEQLFLNLCELNLLSEIVKLKEERIHMHKYIYILFYLFSAHFKFIAEMHSICRASIIPLKVFPAIRLMK